MNRRAYWPAAGLLLAAMAACERAPAPSRADAVAPAPPIPAGEAAPPILEAGPTDQSESGATAVTVYYRHPWLEAITPIRKQAMPHPSPAAMAKQVIDLLTIPPQSDSGSPLWPSSTYVREVYMLADGTIVVDFDGEFIAGVSAGVTEEELMLRGLVNSLLESFPDFQRVRLLVDGVICETLFGHIDTEYPLEARYGVYTIIPESVETEEIKVEELGKELEEIQ